MATVKKVVCDLCKGSGVINNYYEKELPNGDIVEEGPFESDCDMCGGLGKISDYANSYEPDDIYFRRK